MTDTPEESRNELGADGAEAGDSALDETDGDFDPNDPNEFATPDPGGSLFGETSLFDEPVASNDGPPQTESLFGETSLFGTAADGDAPVDPADISKLISTGASFFAEGGGAKPVPQKPKPEPELGAEPEPVAVPDLVAGPDLGEEAPGAPNVEPSEPVAPEDLVDPWSEVLGQTEATRRLDQAAIDPVHAYMLMGSKGSGSYQAALGFAGLLLSAEAVRTGDAAGAARHRRLAMDAAHPDLVLIEASGQTLMVGDAEEIIRQASTSPVEGSRKVIVVRSVEIINEATIGKLLKVVEEPPPTAVFVLLAEEATPEIVTIASRCVPVEFAPVDPSVIEADLVGRGVPADRAAQAALASGGDVERARLLATDEALADRAALWQGLPDRLNGTGAMVYELVSQLRERMDEAQEPLEAAHSQQLEALQERIELTGERGSGKKELIDKQKREIRRQRVDELRFGLATLSRVYRDRLTLAPDPHAEKALAAIQHTAQALIRNPNEPLLLQSLLLTLSAP